MDEDKLTRSFRAMAREMGADRAAARVGVSEKAALRFLAGFPGHQRTRDRIAAFLAANPGRETAALTWAPETAPVGA